VRVNVFALQLCVSSVRVSSVYVYV